MFSETEPPKNDRMNVLPASTALPDLEAKRAEAEKHLEYWTNEYAKDGTRLSEFARARCLDTLDEICDAIIRAGKPGAVVLAAGAFPSENDLALARAGAKGTAETTDSQATNEL